MTVLCVSGRCQSRERERETGTGGQGGLSQRTGN